MTSAIRQMIWSVAAVTLAVGLVLALAVLGVPVLHAAVLDGARPGPAPEAPGAAVAPPAVEPNVVVGAWTRVETCRELVDGLHRYGLEEFASAAVLTDRLRPGAAEPFADRSEDCDGTVGRTVTRIFSIDGRVEALNGLGERTEAATYRFATYRFATAGELLVDRFAGIRIDYRLDGTALTFDVVAPASCTTTRCRLAAQYAVSTFLPGLPWKRT